MNSKKIISKIGDMLFYIFILLCIILTVSISKNNNPGQGPSIFGYRMYTVLTGSMSPTMDKGSLLIVKEVNPSEIQTEDVITFGNNNNNSVTTHRVKEIINEENIKFITQGDANNMLDPEPVDGNLLVGKVIFNVPYLGATLEYIRANIKLVLGLLVFIMVITSLPNKSKIVKNESSSIN